MYNAIYVEKRTLRVSPLCDFAIHSVCMISKLLAYVICEDQRAGAMVQGQYWTSQAPPPLNGHLYRCVSVCYSKNPTIWRCTSLILSIYTFRQVTILLWVKLERRNVGLTASYPGACYIKAYTTYCGKLFCSSYSIAK